MGHLSLQAATIRVHPARFLRDGSMYLSFARNQFYQLIQTAAITVRFTQFLSNV